MRLNRSDGGLAARHQAPRGVLELPSPEEYAVIVAGIAQDTGKHGVLSADCAAMKRRGRPKLPERCSTVNMPARRARLEVFLDDPDVALDTNHLENPIMPLTIGRSNCLLAGGLRAGQRTAVVMSLVHSARINGHEPYAYLKNVLEWLPTYPASRVDELLPHRWVRTSV